MPAPLADVARVAAEDFRRAHPEAVPSALAVNELAAIIEVALLGAVRAERRACAAECTRRGDLWQKTADQPGVNDALRIEATHREKEARYLADLLATRV